MQVQGGGEDGGGFPGPPPATHPGRGDSAFGDSTYSLTTRKTHSYLHGIEKQGLSAAPPVSEVAAELGLGSGRGAPRPGVGARGAVAEEAPD